MTGHDDGNKRPRVVGNRNLPIYREFVKLFVPISLIATLAVLGAALYQQGAFRDRIAVRERNVVLMEKEVFETSLASHLSDALIVAEITAMHLADKLSVQDSRRQLARMLASFAAGREVYDQVRYIDATGQEIVRINMTAAGPISVPKEELQNKKDRPYFLKGMRSKGEVYVSRFDLNVEKGKIERPFKPMIRLVTAVTNDNGDKLGIIVLNYLGKKLLDRLRRASQDSEGRILLLNPQGSWLLGPSPKDEWGFMFKGRSSRSMRAKFPREWTRIAVTERGQIYGPDGLFTFDTICPLGCSPRGGGSRYRGEAEENWKIVSVVEPEKLVPPWRRAMVLFWIGLLALLAAVGGQWARARVKRQEAIEALRENEEKFRMVSNSVQDAIIMIDALGRTTLWSSTAEKMFGYKSEDIIGRDLHSLIAEAEDQVRAAEGLRRFRETGEFYASGRLREVTGVRKDGTKFPAELAVTPLTLGSQWFSVGSVRDITARKRVAEQLEKHSEHLEEVVKERTAELTEMNVELQREIAERVHVQDELRRATAELEARVADRTAELSEANRELNLLSGMGGHLIACNTTEEAFSIVGNYVWQLFPGFSGALYASGNQGALMELVAKWGPFPPTEEVFATDKCWALRKGRAHPVTDSSPEPRCLHVPEDCHAGHMCVPMMAHGETLGLLHLRSDETDGAAADEHGEDLNEPMQRLAVAVAENIGMALANLRLRETLRIQSVRDPLTGLFNRRHMEESLAREFFRAERLESSVGVIMFDIDHFKEFNDTHGHEAGDALLRILGKYLTTHLRNEDMACRFGGEEFVAILPGASLDKTEQRAMELHRALNALHVTQDGKDLGGVTVSFGVAAFPSHGSTAQSVLRAADEALYVAKSRGRDRVEVAGSDRQ